MERLVSRFAPSPTLSLRVSLLHLRDQLILSSWSPTNKNSSCEGESGGPPLGEVGEDQVGSMSFGQRATVVKTHTGGCTGSHEPHRLGKRCNSITH
ncbi:hypothetical protein HMPREF1484_00681 [Dermabacter sp. HFH0086]|nr:hypothetical protein HMPREF1484_00681 [Dermabacter sp. HFH0086]